MKNKIVNKLEKVTKGVKACWSECYFHKCCDCPYKPDRDDDKCVERLGADVLELLNEKSKKGHWTQYDSYGVNDAREYECSQCKGVCTWNTDFCPNCGADMRKVRDEN